MQINFTCTTCGRLDLFIRTMDSFLENCLDKDMINRWIIVDDGSSREDIIAMRERYQFIEVHENQHEQGQAGALKTLFELVDSEWFFHCEDDWLFPIKDTFLTKLFLIAESDERFKNVTLRNWKMDMKRHHTGFFYNISYYMPYTIDASITNSNWFGFSFNPGINHLPSIKSLGAVPTDIISERYWDREYAIEYMKKGFKSANLVGGYIQHIGNDCPAYNREIKKEKCEYIALYKTFHGEEYVIRSLESIYNHVDKIYFSHSLISWNNERGNTVRQIVRDWRLNNDKDNKIREFVGDFGNQQHQYDVAWDLIKRDNEFDWCMLIDTDEVWDEKNIAALKQTALNVPESASCLCTRLYTYIKQENYRIDPPEPLCPVVLVRGSTDRILGPRGIAIKPRAVSKDVFFHHYTYVRNNDDDVFTKIVRSHIGDGLQCCDLNEWREKVWNNLLEAENLHPTIGYEDCWKRVIEIKTKSLTV